jgi:hypothetical protein
MPETLRIHVLYAAFSRLWQDGLTLMPVVRASTSAVIRAPARAVYGLIADYRDGHPRILPPRFFPRLEVERGGTGAGTLIRFQMRAYGVTREIRSEITEPSPGQVLVETDLETGARTTFTVTPEPPTTGLVPDAATAMCRVSIETIWNATGVRGWIARATAPRFLRAVYAEELSRLAALAEGGGVAGSAPGSP